MGEGRNGFVTLVNVIHQQNGWLLAGCGGFQETKVLHFKIESTPIKDTNGKRKFNRMLSFLFVDKRKLFAMTLSFQEFNLVFYTADRNAWLVLNQQGSEIFEGTLGTKGFMDVFYILTST